MDARSTAPRPWARWWDGPGPPSWAIWAAQRCDHQARTPADPDARAAADRLPDVLFCARPRGHTAEHAAPPRDVVGRLRRVGWWAWPDDGVHREADRRDRVAVARTGPPPAAAAPGERECGARGEIEHEAQAGRIGAAVWTEPVRCARPAGHDLPHASAPRPGRSFVAHGPLTWWQWPAPPVPASTRAQRVRARLVVACAVLVALAVVLGLGVLVAGG